MCNSPSGLGEVGRGSVMEENSSQDFEQSLAGEGEGVTEGAARTLARSSSGVCRGAP